MPTKKSASASGNAPEYAFPFTLGADPEFTLISGTRPMSAQDLFKAFVKDKEESRMGYDFPGGNIGWDGHNATGEVRPLPGSPREVAANLKLLFGETMKRMPFIDITTLSIASSAGGHIHLAIPQELNSMATSRGPKWRAIERALASFLLLIVLGENKISRDLRRRGSSYGDLLDFRVEQKFTWPDGVAGYTVEVRGPTAEWITSERIAVGTLAYMAIAWDAILTGSSALSPVADIIFRSQQQAKDTVAPLLANYMNFQRVYLAKIKPFVRQHPAYASYKDELELVLNPDKVMLEKKAVHFSISEGWNLGTSSKDLKVADFMKDTAIEEKTSAFPESVMRNVSQFKWNEDMNVEAFATALAKRCIALGWKPQHEYFLFGMKKGIDALVIRNEAGEFVEGKAVLKTRGDFTVMKEKFDKLVEKARPAYGRVLHPRTGEIATDADMNRVMVGIPYDMRQALDIKSFVKAVLDFEKNPKAYSPLEISSLPEGEGETASIFRNAADDAIAHAFSKGGDAVQAVNRAVSEVGSEELATERLVNGIEVERVTVSDATLDHAEAQARALIRSHAELGGTHSADVATESLLTRFSPRSALVRQNLHDQFVEMLACTEDTLREYLRGATILTAWLVLIQGGANGRSSQAYRTADRYTHMIGKRDSYYTIYCNNLSSSMAKFADVNVVLDLLGISETISRAAVTQMLDINGDTEVYLGDGELERGEASINGAVYVNADTALPTVYL